MFRYYIKNIETEEVLTKTNGWTKNGEPRMFTKMHHAKSHLKMCSNKSKTLYNIDGKCAIKSNRGGNMRLENIAVITVELAEVGATKATDLL